MSVIGLAIPIVEAVVGFLEERKAEVAEATGISSETVGRVSNAIGDFLGRDEKAQMAIMAGIDKARDADTAMNAQGVMPPVVNLLRGLVRPVVTIVAFFWYVYARCMGIVLGAEDYAIIGGIMVFWFGFRPFEKAGTVGTQASRGRSATGGRG